MGNTFEVWSIEKVLSKQMREAKNVQQFFIPTFVFLSHKCIEDQSKILLKWMIEEIFFIHSIEIEEIAWNTLNRTWEN